VEDHITKISKLELMYLDNMMTKSGLSYYETMLALVKKETKDLAVIKRFIQDHEGEDRPIKEFVEEVRARIKRKQVKQAKR